MFSRYSWLIGLRYLRAKRSQHVIGVITILSMAGIALGVAALIVVLAVMTGFLGGLTTFSTFSAEVIERLLAGQFVTALLIAFLHLAGSLALTALGLYTVGAHRLWG